MFAANRKPGEVRRVVTGFDSKGTSIIQSDSVLEPQSVAPGGNAASTTLWTTDAFPTPVLDSTDGATRGIQGLGIRSPNGKSLVLFAFFSLLKRTNLIRHHFEIPRDAFWHESDAYHQERGLRSCFRR